MDYRPAKLDDDAGPRPIAPGWEEGDARSVPPVVKLDVVRPSKWAGKDVPERQWIVPGMIPVGGVTMLSGDGAIGKSTIVGQLLGSTVLGLEWLGLPTLKCPVFGMFCEDEEDELHRRLSAVSAHLGTDLAGLDGISLLLRVAEDNALMTFDPRTEKGTPTPLYAALRTAILDTGSRLIVLDALHDLFVGNENSRPQARQFIQALRRLALDVGGAVVICAHPSLSGLTSGSGASGSTAWNNAVRSRLYLERATGEEADPDERVLRTKKSNYGPLGQEITMSWANGVFMAAGPQSSFQRSTREQSAERAFLECLDMAAKRKMPASASSTSRDRYAPKIFPSMPPGRGFKVMEFKGAMDRLFEAEKIVVGSVKGPDRHTIKCIVRSGK